MRAVTQADRVKQNRSREKVNREQFHSKANASATTSPRSDKIQNNPIGRHGSNLNKSGQEIEYGAKPMDISDKLKNDKKHLMLTTLEMKNQQVESQSMGCDIDEVQDRVASNDSHSRYECTKSGKKVWRENESPVDKVKLKIIKNKKNEAEESARSDVEEMDNRPNKINVKPKVRKWKLHARNNKAKGAKDLGLIGAKRHNSDGNWLNPQHKKKRMLNPPKQPHEGNHISPVNTLSNCSHISSNKIARQLKLTEEILDAMEILVAIEVDVLAGAEYQPRRQL